MENGVKIFDFTLGILTCLPGIDEFAEKIEKILENNDACDKADIIKAYNEGIQKRKDKKFNESLPTLDKLNDPKIKLPWRESLEDQDKIENLDATNTKKACQAIVEFKEYTKYKTVYKGALVAAKEIQAENISFDVFLDRLPTTSHFSILNTKRKDNYLNLNHFLKNILFDKLIVTSIDELKPKIKSGTINWKETIDNAVLFLSENEQMANQKLLELNIEKNKKPDCSKLPSDKVYEDNKVTILDKFAGGWSSLKYIGKCVIESLPNQGYEHLKDRITNLLKDIGLEFLKKLLIVFGTVVSNILTFFAIKAFKILWWIIKAVYYIFKAITEKEEKFKFWGKAVGSGIRIIYIAFMPSERRLKK